MTYYYYGTSGSDNFNYTGSDNLLAYAYEGNDTIYGNTQDDTIYGDAGDDYLFGYTGYDLLYGGSGSDTLSGGDGGDTLSGSYSTSYDSYEYDVLRGGDGFDKFILGASYNSTNYYQGNGYATIEDYNGANDYIQVKGSASSFYLDKSLNYGGTSDLDTAIYQNNGDLLAVVQDNTTIQLTSLYFNFV